MVMMRWALGIEYDGQDFYGWQSQPNGRTVQDAVTKAISQIAQEPISVICAGRTDSGVHATGQVVHFDTSAPRPANAWIRGVNRFLPPTVRVLWACPVTEAFHARFSAIRRAYRYVLYSSPIRPALYHGRVGWTHRALDEKRIREALAHLVGEHDFSAFRSSECQANSPVRILYQATLTRKSPFWLLDFEANAFLHHMIRNILGCLVTIGQGDQDPEWITYLFDCKNRQEAAPTFSASGLYLTRVDYPADWPLPPTGPLPFGN